MAMDLKQVGMVFVGGSVVSLVGTILVPILNQALSFVPQVKLIVDGLTPHVALSYGLGFVAAIWANKKLKLM